MEVLRSGRATASVDPLDGGRLISLTIDQKEILGGAQIQPGLPRGWFYGSFPMAPFAGRIKNGGFWFDGRQYTLPLNAGPHAGHLRPYGLLRQLLGGSVSDDGAEEVHAPVQGRRG